MVLRCARARAPLQSNFDTPGDTSRLDANRFSRSVQPIFRDIFFFLFTRNNYTSGNRNIFAVSHQNDSFPLQLIDQITFLL